MGVNLREAGAVVRSLGDAIARGESGLQSVPGLLLRIINEDLWRDRVVEITGQPVHFDRFIDFLTTRPVEGMGEDLPTLRRLCADRPDVLDALDRATAEKHGGDRKSPDYAIKPDNISLDNYGTSRTYALRKLRKDAPELHERVIQGEISPHAAMLQAGYRKATVSVSLASPESAAATLRRHCDPEFVMQLIACLVAE